MKTSLILFATLLGISAAFGQFDGARVYWPLPKNMNIVAVHQVDAKLNASWNNLNFINPEVLVDNQLHLLTYTRSQPIFGRKFYSTLLLPAGDIEIEIDGPVGTSERIYQHGMGDIAWTNTINLFGAPGMMVKDWNRYELGTVLDFQASISFPTGQYEASDPISMGNNQYRLKIGTPFMQSIGPWIDGKRFVFEAVPSITFIQDNDNYLGQTVKQDEVFTLETHLSRDMTKRAYLSLDYTYIHGGSSDYFSNESGAMLNSQAGQNTHLLGLTTGFKVNDNLSVYLSHAQTLSSSGNSTTNLDGSMTKITVSWAWHDFLEMMRNYTESN